jgi:hypothetical protein
MADFSNLTIEEIDIQEKKLKELKQIRYQEIARKDQDEIKESFKKLEQTMSQIELEEEILDYLSNGENDDFDFGHRHFQTIEIIISV